MLGHFFLAHHLSERTLLHQSDVRVEDLHGNGSVCGQFVEQLDFFLSVIPFRFIFTQTLGEKNEKMKTLVSNVLMGGGGERAIALSRWESEDTFLC